MTVHGAKGLEADIVILPDTTTIPESAGRKGALLYTEDGVFFPLPDAQAPDCVRAAKANADAEALREHRRLLYVALTRAARRALHLRLRGQARNPQRVMVRSDAPCRRRARDRDGGRRGFRACGRRAIATRRADIRHPHARSAAGLGGTAGGERAGAAATHSALGSGRIRGAARLSPARGARVSRAACSCMRCWRSCPICRRCSVPRRRGATSPCAARTRLRRSHCSRRRLPSSIIPTSPRAFAPGIARRESPSSPICRNSAPARVSVGGSTALR